MSAMKFTVEQEDGYYFVTVKRGNVEGTGYCSDLKNAKTLAIKNLNSKKKAA